MDFIIWPELQRFPSDSFVGTSRVIDELSQANHGVDRIGGILEHEPSWFLKMVSDSCSGTYHQS